jgi:hypothetical protein
LQIAAVKNPEDDSLTRLFVITANQRQVAQYHEAKGFDAGRYAAGNFFE